jgi:hypothetical protein
MGKAEKRAPRAEDMSGYLVKRAQSLVHLALEEIVSKQGLGIPHYVVLTLLAETPGLPNAELARKAFVTPQSLNKVLKQLEASGLVERQQSPSNARILNARNERHRRTGRIQRRHISVAGSYRHQSRRTWGSEGNRTAICAGHKACGSLPLTR